MGLAIISKMTRRNYKTLMYLTPRSFFSPETKEKAGVWAREEESAVYTQQCQYSETGILGLSLSKSKKAMKTSK